MSRVVSVPFVKEEIMVAGGRYLAQAGELLNEERLPVRRRLAQAGMLFWRAYASQDLWPRELREQAEPVIRQLLSLGPIDQTVAAMDDPTVRQVCLELAEFVRFSRRFHIPHAA